jgi:hypothetical protein
LDFGILGALEKKYLKSLIVVVYLKEETRNKWAVPNLSSAQLTI